ncbi:reverse transcriptase [Plakobranchus ocellatus]|uniref:Reverse transcriptase n=1 Tax=Plakobranchus ocellatus TaxID=259542 RepID=A0AAV4CXY4_9GAST|nr:reverse transcriptase [Plakobranchus ocellatus]
MYCRKAMLRLPQKSIVEEFKCGKARQMTILQDSEDPAVKSFQPKPSTDCKYKIDETVNQAKEGLKMKDCQWHGRPNLRRGRAYWMDMMIEKFQLISLNGINILKLSKTQA